MGRNSLHAWVDVVPLVGMSPLANVVVKVILEREEKTGGKVLALLST